MTPLGFCWARNRYVRYVCDTEMPKIYLAHWSVRVCKVTPSSYIFEHNGTDFHSRQSLVVDGIVVSMERRVAVHEDIPAGLRLADKAELYDGADHGVGSVEGEGL
ncbi:hypothetical protein S83_065991 [Arachis hypogaea]